LRNLKRTYIDANLLIAAFKGNEDIAQRALQILDDPERQLVASDFIRLEVLPKPTFYKLNLEVKFMLEVLKNTENVPVTSKLTEKAVEFAMQYDLSPIDSLHISAANMAAVDEFVTLEKPTKPICKVIEIRVKSLYFKADTVP